MTNPRPKIHARQLWWPQFFAYNSVILRDRDLKFGMGMFLGTPDTMVKSENCYHIYFLVCRFGAIMCHPVPRAPLLSRGPKFWPNIRVLAIPQAYNH